MAHNEREQLRAGRKLHLISDPDAGSSIEIAPRAVYGFTYSPQTEGSPMFSKQTYQVFEIHKLGSGDVHLIGYMTPAHAEALASGKEPAEVRLYPEPHEDATQLVDVPRDRILRPKPTSREHGNYFPFTLAPAEQ